MKNLILLFIILFLFYFPANAQWLKTKPKYLSDLNFYPKPGGYPDVNIISINKINLPVVEKVFPHAKLCDIFMEGQDFTGKVQSHAYHLLFKGKYYEEISYLSQIEQRANKKKLSTYSLKERVEAYATVAFYEYLKGVVEVDSMIILENNLIFNDNTKEIPAKSFKIYFKVNNNPYNGFLYLLNEDKIFSLSIVELKRDIRFH